MTSDLRRALARGPRSMSELQRQLSVSKSTLQRALEHDRQEVLTAGRARATRYAARRGIEGLITPVPVFEVDADGGIAEILTLHPVEPFGFWVEGRTPDVDSGFVSTEPREPDLPWFFADARPQGFLGRLWARSHPDQGYPLDPDRWSADQVLRFLAHYGTDLVGALVVGPFARDLLGHAAPLDVGREGYPARAAQILAGAQWGSSPGGDQPKFVLRGRFVKFSPPTDNPMGRRWADLLLAEHVVHQVLQVHGVGAARSEVVDVGERRFLEIERFDRHGEHGRSGVISLAAVDRGDAARDLRRWSLGTAPLVAEGRLSAEDHRRVEWLEAFGLLVANTDMHPGNLSFRMRGTRLLGLAPVYDMLPMAFAPRYEELPSDVWRPSTERSAFPETAIRAAREVWGQVAASSAASDDFRRIAERQAAGLPGAAVTG